MTLPEVPSPPMDTEWDTRLIGVHTKKAEDNSVSVSIFAIVWEQTRNKQEQNINKETTALVQGTTKCGRKRENNEKPFEILLGSHLAKNFFLNLE